MPYEEGEIVPAGPVYDVKPPPRTQSLAERITAGANSAAEFVLNNAKVSPVLA